MADTMQGLKRTHYCGTLTAAEIGSRVVVCGWVQKLRNLGNLIFIDLRDRTGILQLAFDDGTDRQLFQKASAPRAEYVLMAAGILRQRESVNNDIPTGQVELYVDDLLVQSFLLQGEPSGQIGLLARNAEWNIEDLHLYRLAL